MQPFQWSTAPSLIGTPSGVGKGQGGALGRSYQTYGGGWIPVQISLLIQRYTSTTSFGPLSS